MRPPLGEAAGIKGDHTIGFPQLLAHLSNQDLDQWVMSSCGPKPPCRGGALWGQRRAGRRSVRELPGCPPYRGHVLHTLGPHRQPRLPDGQAERGAGQVWSPPGALRFTWLSHSETVCDTAWAGPDRSPPPPPHAAPAYVGARKISNRPAPRWHETCGERGQGARVGRRASRLQRLRRAHEASSRELRPHGAKAPREEGGRRCN
jgi:hypothetical protein